MSTIEVPVALRGLKRRILVIDVLLITLIVLLTGVAAVTFALSLSYWHLTLATLLAVGGVILMWSVRNQVVGAAKHRLAEAAWLLRSTQPREAILYFSMALIIDGIVCVLLDPEGRKQPLAAAMQLSKLQYPRQEHTPVTLYASETCPTLLVELKGGYVDGIRLDQATFARKKRWLSRVMGALLLCMGLGLSSVIAWALYNAWTMQQGLSCIARSAQPQSTAEILATDLIEETQSTRSGATRILWRPVIDYRYTWAGEPRQSSALGCVERAWRDRSEAAKVVASFEVGHSYPLWIDPGHPGRAHLVVDDPEWVKEQRTNALGLAISMLVAWLLGHLMIDHLAIRLNLKRLSRIERMLGWEPVMD